MSHRSSFHPPILQFEPRSVGVWFAKLEANMALSGVIIHPFKRATLLDALPIELQRMLDEPLTNPCPHNDLLASVLSRYGVQYYQPRGSTQAFRLHLSRCQSSSHIPAIVHSDSEYSGRSDAIYGLHARIRPSRDSLKGRIKWPRDRYERHRLRSAPRRKQKPSSY